MRKPQMRAQPIKWRASTRNHHIGTLDGFPVVAVLRPQKLRADGTPPDWRIETLGSPHLFTEVFTQYDPRDLDSTKSAADARVRWAIGVLYRSMFTLRRRRKGTPP